MSWRDRIDLLYPTREEEPLSWRDRIDAMYRTDWDRETEYKVNQLDEPQKTALLGLETVEGGDLTVTPPGVGPESVAVDPGYMGSFVSGVASTGAGLSRGAQGLLDLYNYSKGRAPIGDPLTEDWTDALQETAEDFRGEGDGFASTLGHEVLQSLTPTGIAVGAGLAGAPAAGMAANALIHGGQYLIDKEAEEGDDARELEDILRAGTAGGAMALLEQVGAKGMRSGGAVKSALDKAGVGRIGQGFAGALQEGFTEGSQEISDMLVRQTEGRGPRTEEEWREWGKQLAHATALGSIMGTGFEGGGAVAGAAGSGIRQVGDVSRLRGEIGGAFEGVGEDLLVEQAEQDQRLRALERIVAGSRGAQDLDLGDLERRRQEYLESAADPLLGGGSLAAALERAQIERASQEAGEDAAAPYVAEAQQLFGESDATGVGVFDAPAQQQLERARTARDLAQARPVILPGSEALRLAVPEAATTLGLDPSRAYESLGDRPAANRERVREIAKLTSPQMMTVDHMVAVTAENQGEDRTFEDVWRDLEVRGVESFEEIRGALREMTPGDPLFQLDRILPPHPTQSNYDRVAKRKPGVGAPKNPRTVFEDEQGRFVVGPPTTEDWKERVLGTADINTILKDAVWYDELEQQFTERWGEEEGSRMALAWLASQKNTSPAQGFLGLMKVRERLRSGGSRKKAGLADSEIETILQGETPGSGFALKLYDFSDSGAGSETRRYYGDDPRAGEPAVIDVHSARDMGLVGQQVVNYVRARFGDEAADSLQRDQPPAAIRDQLSIAPSDTQYEWAANHLRSITADLNAEGWLGKKDWKPREVQAVGWMAYQRLLAQTLPKAKNPEDIAFSINRSTYEVPFEVDFGEGAPLVEAIPEWQSATPETKERVTREVSQIIGRIADEGAGTSGGELFHGLGGWQGELNPAARREMLASPEGANLWAAIAGYLGQQTAVMATRRGTGTDVSRAAFEVSSPAFKDLAVVRRFWDALSATGSPWIEGFTPIVDPKTGHPAMRIVATSDNLSKAEQQGRVGLANMEAAVRPILESAAEAVNVEELRARPVFAEVAWQGNDWKVDKDGTGYLGTIRSLASPEFAERLVNQHRVDVEQAIRQSLAREGSQPAAFPEPAAGPVSETGEELGLAAQPPLTEGGQTLYQAEPAQEEEAKPPAARERREKVKGSLERIDPADARKAVLKLARGESDFSTVVHELFHYARPFLPADAQMSLAEWAGEKDAQPGKLWSREAEERAARGFERYLLSGAKQGDEVDPILRDLREWMLDVYAEEDALRDFEGNEEVTQVFANLIGVRAPLTRNEKRARARVLASVEKAKGLVDSETFQATELVRKLDQVFETVLQRNKLKTSRDRLADMVLKTMLLSQDKDAVIALEGGQRLWEAAHAMRLHVKGLSSQILEVAKTDPYILGKKVTSQDDFRAEIEKNLGRYLRREYEAFQAPDRDSLGRDRKVEYAPGEWARSWREFIQETDSGKKLRRAAEGWILENDRERYTDRIVSQGKRTEDEITNQMILDAIRDDLDNWIGGRGTKGARLERTVTLRDLKKRLELSEPLRQYLGEISETKRKYLLTIQHQASTLHQYNVLRDLLQDGELFSDVKTQSKGHTVELRAGGGALMGKWTSPAVAEVIEGRMVPGGGDSTLLHMLRAVSGGAKGAMTVGNPGTHSINYTANYLFHLANGYGHQLVVNPMVIARAHKLSAKAVGRELATYPMPQWARKVIDQDYNKDEIALRDELIRRGVIGQALGREDLEIISGARGRKGTAMDHAIGIATVGKLGRSLYLQEDEVHKVMGYLYELSRLTGGKPATEAQKDFAAEAIQQTMPTFSRVIGPSRWVRSSILSGLQGRFSSFISESARILVNMHRMLGYHSAMAAGKTEAAERIIAMPDPGISKSAHAKIAAQRALGLATVYAGKTMALAAAGAALGWGDDEDGRAADEIRLRWMPTGMTVTRREKGKVWVTNTGRLDTFDYPKELIRLLYDASLGSRLDTDYDPRYSEIDLGRIWDAVEPFAAEGFGVEMARALLPNDEGKINLKDARYAARNLLPRYAVNAWRLAESEGWVPGDRDLRPDGLLGEYAAFLTGQRDYAIELTKAAQQAGKRFQARLDIAAEKLEGEYKDRSAEKRRALEATDDYEEALEELARARDAILHLGRDGVYSKQDLAKAWASGSLVSESRRRKLGLH